MREKSGHDVTEEEWKENDSRYCPKNQMNDVQPE